MPAKMNCCSRYNVLQTFGHLFYPTMGLTLTGPDKWGSKKRLMSAPESGRWTTNGCDAILVVSSNPFFLIKALR